MLDCVTAPGARFRERVTSSVLVVSMETAKGNRTQGARGE